MAITTYSRSFGIEHADQLVVIRESVTQNLATIFLDTFGNILNNQGQARLDFSGSLSVYLDTSKTWVVSRYDGVPIGPGSLGGNLASLKPVEVDASYFGFTPGVLSSPTIPETLIALAPDCSDAARRLEDYFMNWREKSYRPVVVNFSQGYYKFDGLLFKENSDVFYQRSGLVLKGAGSWATFFAATQSSKAQFIGIAGKTNWLGAPAIQGVTLYGAGALNPYQAGVFLNPDFGNSIGFGGSTSAHWKDVVIRNFEREQLWLKGGSEDFRVPFQYGLWEDITCHGRNRLYNVAKLTGQMGPPFNFKGLQCYGVGSERVTLSSPVAGSDIIVVGPIAEALRPGMSIVGPSVPANTYIVSKSGTSVTANIALSIPSGEKITFGSEAAPILHIGLDNRSSIQLASASASSDNLVFLEPHRLKTGDRFKLPTPFGGLASNVDYFAYLVDDYTIKVATTYVNATTTSPVFVQLTDATATPLTHYAQVVQTPGSQIGSTQVVFDTLTVQGGGVGVNVDSATIVSMYSLHIENTKTAVKVTGSNVSIVDATIGNGAIGSLKPDDTAGYVFDTAQDPFANIVLNGAIVITGETDNLTRSPVDNIKFPHRGLLGNPPVVTGAGISGRMPATRQLSNTAELDLTRSTSSEYLLNTGTTPIVNIRSFAYPGQKESMRVWPAAVNGWVEFGITGNLFLGNRNIVGNTLRVPVGAYLTFTATAVNNGWTLSELEMPVHTDSWPISATIASAFVESKTIACPGARVGDLIPTVSINAVIPDGLVLSYQVTAVDTVTVSLTNVTANPITMPTAPVGGFKLFVRQNR